MKEAAPENRRPRAGAHPAGRGRRRGRHATTAIVACLVGALVCQRAEAFKWHSCPAPPLPVYPSTVGATTAPFVHPGHDLTIVLNEAEAALSGGFALEPDGNQVRITFRSLFGTPIELAPRPASATSPTALTITFPDSARDLGKVLAGPVEIQVFAGTRHVAAIAARDLVALPPANDVTALVLTPTDQVVLGALSADGDIWVPARFHGEPMSMPGCEGAFILPVPVLVGGAEVVGEKLTPFGPLDRVRGILAYLGDMVINGTNFYGMLFPHPIRPQQVSGTLGVSLCRLNDAADLVLRVLGDQSWTESKVSPFRTVAADSAAVALLLKPATPVPGLAGASPTDETPSAAIPGQRDSFGNDCLAAPRR